MISTLTRSIARADPNATKTVLGDGPSPGDGILPRLPDYEVIEEIGRGGGGIVFRARQGGADRDVALKFLLHGTGTVVERLRFREEVRALGKLNHPNVVVVHEVGEADGCPFYTMELMLGGSLSQQVHKHTFTSDESAALVETLARAIQVAHDAGVLHRDLKPSNILLSRTGTPKIADFGLAKRWDDSPEADTVDRVTRTREVIGTPAYMAPEQAAAKHGAVGPATDVYGLGTILYELLAGRPPFKGKDLQDTLWQVVNSPVVPPRDRNRQVPRPLEAITLKCLEKDRARRYSSAQDLADDLARYRRREETNARPLASIARTVRALRRHIKAAALIAAGVLILGGAIAVGAKLLEDPDQAVEQLERNLRDGKTATLIGETGRPKWHRWLLSEATFTESAYHDKTCCMQTGESCRLELLREVPASGFRMSAEIRHEGTFDAGDQSEVGVYFARTVQPWPSGGDIENWFGVGYNDFRSLTAPDFIPAVKIATLSGYMRLIRSDRPLSPASNGVGGGKEFTPAPHGSIGGWRQVVFEVRPAGINGLWRDDTGKLVPFLQTNVDATLLDRDNQSRWNRVAENIGELAGPHCPSWSPMGSVGLYLIRGKASFRNVIIQP